ncbi:nitrilase-related carbon-nitrogen hydrolase [Pectinatus frisingensis]|uniref:nitrilase-related carbon-nitrogen hydrolase n=1 Tax=Pectinatus frisingensis TaxID=865 RepID=UPI0018C78932|nr:nitrilase-related carbon-nitrogen hydrolase [Pectinatus frisingensis]
MQNSIPNTNIYRKFLLFAITVGSSSIAYYLSLSDKNIWLLLWIAPLPICIYALKHSLPSSIAASLAVSTISNSAMILFSPLPPVVIKLLLIGVLPQAITYSVVLVIYRYIALHYKHWSCSLVFAAGITAFEFVSSLFSRGGSIGSIAYSQTSNLPVIQIASITGIWAITFLLSIVPAGAALAIHYHRKKYLKAKCALFPLGLLLLIIGFGLYSLFKPVNDPAVEIGIAAEPITLDQYMSVASNKDPQQVSDLIQRYTEDIEELLQSGAKIVLLPEKTFTISDQYDFLNRFADMAKRNNIYLIIGMSNKVGETFYNSAFIFSPNGELLQKYNKQHLLPPLENKYTPGTGLSIIDTDIYGKLGIEICKDMDFSHPALNYSQEGTGLLFVPALDFHYDRWTHGRVAVMRGVEGNYSVARAGQWGMLTLSDNYGRIINIKSTNSANEATLLRGSLIPGKGSSIYSRFGDWFGWLCIILFVGSIFLCFSKFKRNKMNK